MQKVLLFFLILTLGEAFSNSKKPNIIFFFADDIGYETLNCYGGLDFKTPHLNQMAKVGVLFEKMYTNPVCTPSRVSLHTGLHTFRHRHTDVLPVHKGTRQKVDFNKFPTFAQLMRANGYQTSTTGKWQLATMEIWPEHIKHAGFDSWCIWQIWENNQKTDRHWNATLNHDGKIIKNIEHRFGPDVIMDYIFDQMETAQQQSKPFMILHNELLPHWPLVQTPDDKKLGREAKLEYMIAYMDKLLGKLLKKIEDMGIRENTYVFFMGDNGTWVKDFINPKYGQPGEGKHTRHTLAGNVDPGKKAPFDGGTHVPLIAWGADSIPKGHVNSELIDVVDLFATFCEISNTPIPGHILTDGRSFAPQIHGKPGPSRSWTYQGVGKIETLFDGSWRYFPKTKQLWDARYLPKERLIPKTELPERKEIIDSFEKIYQRITSNQPQDPF